eukprot:Skav219278  [mRNA]  locus=scaffold2157:20542:23079:- [translate_table: standard]
MQALKAAGPSAKCLQLVEASRVNPGDQQAKFLLAVTSGGQHGGVRILSEKSAEMMMSDLSSLLGSRVPSNARPYDDAGLGLSGIGELQRRGAPSWGGWCGTQCGHIAS